MNFYKGLRGLLKASALTSVMFVMQACYGSPKNFDMVEIRLSGHVTDKANGQPLQGIRLDAYDAKDYYDNHAIEYTDENGYFEMVQWGNSNIVSSLAIEVMDGNGNYLPFDTLVSSDSDLTTLKIKLESNQ